LEVNEMRKLLRFIWLSGLIVLPAAAVPVASCDATRTNCSIPENVMLRLPLAAIAGDVIVQDPASTNVSDVFRIFNNLIDTGAGTGLGNLAILYSADDNSPLPAPSTYSANAVIVKKAATGSTSYLGNGTNYYLDTSATAAKIVYTGDTSADYHDPAQLSAVLTVLSSGALITGAAVTFTFGTQSCGATTNASGLASCTLVLNQAAGNSTVTASFNGIFGSYAGTSVSKPFVITLEETTLSYTGDTVIAEGGTAHLSGVLLEDNVTPISGRTVTFTLGTGASAQTCQGTSDSTGKAICTISPVLQPLGPGTVSDSFASDAFYRPASASANTMLFAFLTTGGFVLGDQTAQVGTHSTFWGAQWSTDDRLSGGAAPSDFKGFAESLSSEPPTCGVVWSSRPANSARPPGTVPAYMGVLVSPSVLQSGSTLSGTASGIVVVKTDSGYGPDPGQAGTGTVVARYCH
jgi:hypothetical protein